LRSVKEYASIDSVSQKLTHGSERVERVSRPVLVYSPPTNHATYPQPSQLINNQNIMKITYMGKEVRDSRGRFSSFKKGLKNFAKKVLFYFMVAVGISIATLFGGYYLGSTTTYQNVIAENKIPPILVKIAKCESNNLHYGKSGQVILSANTNDTVDVGRYQINSVWFKKATELGLDVTKEQDNEKMAVWIYENRGTEDWYSSKNCWQK